MPGRAFDRAAPSPVAVCPPQPHRVPAPVQESRPSFPSPRRGPTELKKAKKKREARSAVAEEGGQGRAYLPGNRGGGRAPVGRRALPRGPGPAAGGGAAAVPAGWARRAPQRGAGPCRAVRLRAAGAYLCAAGRPRTALRTPVGGMDAAPREPGPVTPWQGPCSFCAFPLKKIGVLKCKVLCFEILLGETQ